MNFNGDGQGWVVLLRCSGDLTSDCVSTGVSSSHLVVHRTFELRTLRVVKGTSSTPGQFIVEPGTWTYDGFSGLWFSWALRDQNGQEVGAATDVPLDIPSFRVFIEVPSGLSGGDYTLDVTAHGTFAGGPVSSPTVSVDVSIDTTLPIITAMSRDVDLFFPVPDGYRDIVRITTAVSEPSTFEYRLRGDDGSVLAALPKVSSIYSPPGEYAWRGAVGGDIVPAGTYRIGVRAQDTAGNYSEWVNTDSFRIDLAKERKITVTTQLLPAKVVSSRFVGKCSSLASPSSHGWKGSLGYYSQTKCKREKNDASVVVVWHAWWLPVSIDGVGSYNWFRVDAYGGAAKGDSRGNYMVLGYIDNKGRFDSRKLFNSKMKWHAGLTRGNQPRQFIHFQNGRPFVVWSNGLTAGSRYDIRYFRLSVNLRALIEPDGTFIPAPRPAARPAITAPGNRLAANSPPSSFIG